MINTPLSLERDLGIVVVGLGAIGLEHAAVAMSTPGISLVGVVEPREAERERFAHTNQVNSYRSFDEALADSQVEAVILCTRITSTLRTRCARSRRDGTCYWKNPSQQPDQNSPS